MSFEKGKIPLTYLVIFSWSFKAKKKVKHNTKNCKNKIGKLLITSAMKLTKEFVVLLTKEAVIEPTCSENVSEANKEGNTFFKGVMKSIFWVNSKNSKDWFKRMGVKNQIGVIITIAKKRQINEVERFLDLTYLFNFLKKGYNINANISAIKTASS